MTTASRDAFLSQHRLDRLNGAWIDDHAWRSLGHAITTARAHAKQWSSQMLYLRSDEKLMALSADTRGLLNDQDDPIATHILIDQQTIALAEPRLFNTASELPVEGDVVPLIGDDKLKQVRVVSPHLRILAASRSQDITRRETTQLAAEYATLVPHQRALTLPLALKHLSEGNAAHALDVLANHSESEIVIDSQFEWCYAYLSGAAHHALEDLGSAIVWYQRAIDIDPDRAEPYARLIELLLEAEQYEKASDLASMLEMLEKPSSALYFEPHLVGRDSLALCLKAYVAANQRSDGARLYSKVSVQLNKTESMTQALAARRESETQRKAAKSPPRQNDEDTGKRTPKLTIGMATYDDFDGVYFTVMSILLFHADCLPEIELLIVDNNPDSLHGEAVATLASNVGARYLQAREFKGTTVRERVFLEAKGDFVMCVDCHVFLHQGVVMQLLDYIDKNPNSKDIWHGPLISEGHHACITHMEERWQHGFYGVFEKDPRGVDPHGEPFEIAMQGLALFVCKRSEWAGFNRKFRGFGGEEGYIHYKFALNGGKTLCLPFLRWTHRFPRPNGVKYENKWEARIRNYLIGWREIGRDPQSIYDHYSEQMGAALMAHVHTALEHEMNSPFWPFDSIYFLCESDERWAQGAAFRAHWGLTESAQRIEYDATSSGEQAAINRIHALAQRQRLPNVLILKNENEQDTNEENTVREWLAPLLEDNPEQSQVSLPHGTVMRFLRIAPLDS